MNLRSLAAALWRRRLLALLVLAVELGALFAWLGLAPRRYTAVATVAATPQQTLAASSVNFDQLLGTLAKVVDSRPLLDVVAGALPVHRSESTLENEVSGSVVSGTVLIQISAVDASPQVAADIANAIAAQLPRFDPSGGYFTFVDTERAVAPPSYSSPQVPIIVLAGVVVGIVLAIVAAVARDRTARTVENAEETAAATGAAVLGLIPRPTGLRSLPAADAASAEFAPLRALRVALEFASSEQPTRTLVVTSVGPDPWGGWLEANLAVSLAEVGHRVLLVDADRGARRRHEVLDGAGAPGFYDMLSGSATLDAVAIAGPVENVTILPVGHADVAAPSLLEMRFHRLLDEIDEKYDVILIHAAPTTESDDARIMAIDGAALLSVPYRRARQRSVEQAAEELRQFRVRVMGAVLVGVRGGRLMRRGR